MFNITDSKLSESMLLTPSTAVPYQQASVKMTLENTDLWRSFHSIGTEMVITKQGRRMFPHCSVSLTGLQPLANYIIMVEMIPVDNYKYKWRNECWEVAGEAEPQPPHRMYWHRNSAAPGNQLMKQSLSFLKIKLTNNVMDQSGHFILHSMQRYYPRFHVILADSPYTVRWGSFHTFTFPETAFTAVTAYQNQKIKMLKIAHNPFAKAFREGGTYWEVKRSHSNKRRRTENSTLERCCGSTSPGNTSPGLQMMPFLSQSVKAEKVLTQPYLREVHPSARLVERHSSERIHPATPELPEYEYSYEEQNVSVSTTPPTYRFAEYHRYPYLSSNAEAAQAFHPLTSPRDHGTPQYGFHHSYSADWSQSPVFSC